MLVYRGDDDSWKNNFVNTPVPDSVVASPVFANNSSFVSSSPVYESFDNKVFSDFGSVSSESINFDPIISSPSSSSSDMWFKSTGDGGFTTPWNPTGKLKEGNFVTPWNPTGASPEQLQNEWIQNKYGLALGTEEKANAYLRENPDSILSKTLMQSRISVGEDPVTGEGSWAGGAADRIVAATQTGGLGIFEGMGQYWKETAKVGAAESANIGRGVISFITGQTEAMDESIAASNDLIAKMESDLAQTDDPNKIAFINDILTQEKQNLMEKVDQKSQLTFNSDFDQTMKNYEKVDYIGKGFVEDVGLNPGTWLMMGVGAIPKVLEGVTGAVKGSKFAFEGAEAVAGLGKEIRTIDALGDAVKIGDVVTDATRVVKTVPSDASGVFKLADEIIDSSRNSDDIIDIIKGLDNVAPFMTSEQKIVAADKYFRLIDKLADANYVKDAEKLQDVKKVVKDLPQWMEEGSIFAKQRLADVQKVIGNRIAVVDDVIDSAKGVGGGGAIGGAGGGAGAVGAGAVNNAVATAVKSTQAPPYVLARQGLNVVREVVGNTITVGAGATVAAGVGALTLKDDNIDKEYSGASKVFSGGKEYSNIDPDKYYHPSE